MQTLTFFDEQRLADHFGELTLRRGRDYAARGVVTDLVTSDTHGVVLLEAWVTGSVGRRYRVTVTLADGGGSHGAHDEYDDEDVDGYGAGGPTGHRYAGYADSRCTCPVHRMCKHGAAVVLAARSTLVDLPARGWERSLGPLLDELEDTAEAAAAAALTDRRLALQVELTSALSSSHYTWGAGAARGPRRRQEHGRGHLRLRPLQAGARDKWVKTGASWADLERRAIVETHPGEQLGALIELLAAYRAASRQPYGGVEQLLVSFSGPTLWHHLHKVQAAGVPLVPAGQLRDVRVEAQPVRLEVDVQSAGARAHVAVGVRHDDELVTGDRLEILGTTGHGVALWTPQGQQGQQGQQWEVVLAALNRPAGPRVRRLVEAGQVLEVPDEDVGELVTDFLPRLQRHLPVASSDRSVVVPDAAPPRLALAVTWKAVDEVHVAWSWRYRVGEDDRIYGLDEDRGRRGIRRSDAEAELLGALDLSDEQVAHLCRDGRRDQGLLPERTFTGFPAVAFAEESLGPLEAGGQVEIEEIGVRPVFEEATDAPVIRFAPRNTPTEDGAEIAARTDWLDLEVIVTIGAHAVSLPALLEALTHGAERIVLPNGLHLRIDRPEFAQLAALVRAARDMVEADEQGIRVHRGDLGLWDELAEIGLVDAQAAQWVDAARSLRSLDRLPEADPVGVEAELRSYQLEGFRWLAMLWEWRLGGILADDMGLGKTLQTLALIAHARSGDQTRRHDGPFLVVAPTSVVSTWAQEAAAFTPGLRVRTVTESRSRRGSALADVHGGGEVDLVVTSYTLFRLEAGEYAALPWGGLVLDEAQMVKNHTGKTYQCVRRLDVPFRLALTGTPMENRLMELWSLLSIVAPGLYPYPRRFAEAVANPVEKEHDTAVLERFRRRIRPFLLRRTKDLVAADLPAKQEQVLEVTLTPRHRKVYDTHLARERQRVLGLIGDFDRQRVAIFRSLTKLRQLSLDAALVDPDLDGIGSAKIDVLVDHLQEVLEEGHPALVFSQFTSFLQRVRSRLDAAGIDSAYLDGRTRRRGEVIGGFKQGAAPVFLISLKAGGVGLTLTEADYVFVLDPWWNPAVEAQAVDRAHRIGQRHPVIVYRLVAADTIEEKVMDLKARKAALFAQVLDGGGGAGTPIDADDIRELLSS